MWALNDTLMPLYEYKCESCGQVVELLVSFTSRDDPDETCEKCGGKLVPIFSMTAGGSKACESCTTTSCGTSG